MAKKSAKADKAGATSKEGPTPEVLAAVKARFYEAFEEAQKSPGTDALVALRSQYLGPKGELTLLLRSVGQLPPELRRTAGADTNALKGALETDLSEVLSGREAEARQAELRKSRLDLTLAGRLNRPLGRVHPVQRVIQEVTEIFQQMGFAVAQGPEVELDLYNFAKLNFPENHPARDMQDTFFVSPKDPKAKDEKPGERVLRTHTSPVQIRALEAHGVPIRIVSPGRVYRCDADATHSPMFHQIEGLWVDEGVSLAHLKGTLERFTTALFGERKMRLRPSFFPFVEPGVEMDIQCVFCGGDGCRVCKQTGWMEVLGAGMVHPNVLEACGVDSEQYTGFAFGLGVDRLAMLRYQVDDIAHLYRGDARFLSQL